MSLQELVSATVFPPAPTRLLKDIAEALDTQNYQRHFGGWRSVSVNEEKGRIEIAFSDFGPDGEPVTNRYDLSLETVRSSVNMTQIAWEERADVTQEEVIAQAEGA